MHGSQQRDQPLRARSAYGWARRLSGVLTPLVPLAVSACRGDCPRVEASQQRVEASQQRAEDTQQRAGAPASPAATARPEKRDNRSSRAPTATSVPAPWLLTIQPTTGEGARIASMDIRSFTSPLLEPGDVILAVDGRPVHSLAGLEGYLRARVPGDMVVLTVLRNETTINYAMLQVPTGDAPAPPSAAATRSRGGG
ncbi:PDZ domain-containing protein [Sorangium sp. So ce363]|uniref:PDZ domain-containing protein n=1 Tax=Sorangium sp. So ce363 TaxID=3133304 RepID=UPI003F62A967